MTAIENALQGLRQFATSDETRAMLDRLGKILTEQNKFNIEAVVRISDHLEHEVKYYSLSDHQYCEEWEVLTGYYQTDHGELDEDERTAEMCELQESIDKFDNDIAELEDKIEDVGHLGKTLSMMKGTLSDMVEKREVLSEVYTDWDDAEFIYDEVLMNYFHRYCERVDHDAAKKAGLAVVSIMDDDGDFEDWLGLCGCGMDLSAKFMEYCAHAHGCIDSRDASKLRDTKYVKYVVGDFDKFCDILGITECVQTAQEDADSRMEEFNKSITSLGKARDSGEIDGFMAGILGMSAFCKAR